ncbi:MAG: hypothetical protein ACXVCS_04845 [Bdellovibrionota bacterium]
MLTLFFSRGALAASASIDDVCPGLDQIRKKVYICADNALAARIAHECALFLFSRWQETVPAFEAVVKKNLTATDDGQKNSLGHSQTEYQMNADLLDIKIDFFGKYADLIATYPGMMMDGPGGKDDSTSASCFNSAFHAVEKIVSRLDGEIVNTLHEQAALLALHSDLGKRVASVNSSISSGSAASPSIPFSATGRKYDNRPSDITGTSKDRHVASAGKGSAQAESPLHQAGKVASGGSGFTAPATRQIFRNSEISGGTGTWAGTKVGQEILSELERANTESEAAKKNSAVSAGASLPMGSEGTQPGGLASGIAVGINPLAGGEPKAMGQIPSSNALFADEGSIFTKVSRKYRQLEPLMKR